MMFLISALAGIAVSELFLQLPFLSIAQSSIMVLNKASNVIRSRNISDHWKERAVQWYSLISLIKNLQLVLLMGIALAPAGFMILFLPAFLDFSMTPTGLIFITAVSCLYIAVRKRGRSSDYGAGARLLHYLALDNKFIAEVSFDIELTLQRLDPAPLITRKHVFVAGLARAGTTLLMRRFYSTGQFASLTYRDMPFVLMPNLWKNINAISVKKSTKKERLHGDGIFIDVNSPEALEEVFWRIFSPSYIRRNQLIPMSASDENVAKFRSYVAAIINRYQRKKTLRYLSKNNNNLLRLQTLKKAFPDALIIIPFRDPVQQAGSLLRMHRKFVSEYQSDPFIGQYMRWLVHHEFGADHRPFRFEGGLLKFCDPESLNYWLQEWFNVYHWLASNAPESSVFLCYETFCEYPEEVWADLTRMAGIPDETRQSEEISLKRHVITSSIDEELLNKTRQVYDALKSRWPGYCSNSFSQSPAVSRLK